MEWKREHNTAQKKKEANCGELNEENTLRFPSLFLFYLNSPHFPFIPLISLPLGTRPRYERVQL